MTISDCIEITNAIISLILMMDSKPFVVFVLGGPGAGKGTQCTLLSKEYGFIHLSAGDLLREERKSGTSTGDLIEDYIRNGKIVPSEITVGLLNNAMVKNGWEKSKFLIDGFPRNQENVDGWNEVVGDKAYFHSLLYFDCSEETMEKRLLSRAVSSGRVDDNIESIKKRFLTYVNETKPVIDYFASINKVFKIDAAKSVEEIYSDLKAIFDPILKS